jgi:hypothetical protein
LAFEIKLGFAAKVTLDLAVEIKLGFSARLVCGKG